LVVQRLHRDDVHDVWVIEHLAGMLEFMGNEREQLIVRAQRLSFVTRIRKYRPPFEAAKNGSLRAS
jgi:hypothetical protein